MGPVKMIFFNIKCTAKLDYVIDPNSEQKARLEQTENHFNFYNL